MVFVLLPVPHSCRSLSRPWCRCRIVAAYGLSRATVQARRRYEKGLVAAPMPCAVVVSLSVGRVAEARNGLTGLLPLPIMAGPAS
jgi:hypothetical protein